MRTFTLSSIILLLTVVVLINCGQSTKRTRKPVTSIRLSSKNSDYTVGDKISINLVTKLKDGSLNKTDLFLDGKQIFTTKSIESAFIFETNNLGVGTHYLKTVASTTDGTTGENYTEFLLLSDIIPEKFGYKVIRSFPHSTDNFTEGLEIRNGFLYEGTGQEGYSAIFKTDMSTWKTVKSINIDKQYFGEGITILNDKLYQLTYKTQIGFVRDINTFELIKTWNYKNEQGWGLTNDGKSIIMSDGTQFIYYLNSETLNVESKIQVCDNKGIVININELEYIDGKIWANLWNTDTIVKIDPKTGKIVAEIDFKGLLGTNLTNQKNQVDVFNGIAYDNSKNKIYVTGKYWPKLFEIELIKKSK